MVLSVPVDDFENLLCDPLSKDLLRCDRSDISVDSICLHKTYEKEKKHVPIASVSFDLNEILRRFVYDIIVNFPRMVTFTRFDDSKWADLEVDVIPEEFIQPMRVLRSTYFFRIFAASLFSIWLETRQFISLAIIG